MAKSGSRESGRGKAGGPAAARWAGLTWDDLEGWAGSGSVTRGRSYQRGGRVKDLKVSGEGALVATVVGGDRYATTVDLVPGRKRAALESSCTCPVGVACKHAVAVVAEYLQAVADGRAVPVAADDDPRWALIEEGGSAVAEEWDEDDDEDEDWDDEEEDEAPARKARAVKRPARASSSAGWDAKIEQHLRARSHGELADLVWSLVRRFPEVYREFRERLELEEGNVGRLLAEARREIRAVTSEPAWRNSWTGEGSTPDYSRIRHRFERLLELGHADEVVSLGRDFLSEGQRQVGESHDEGETATAFAECLPVVFQAVARSSLSAPERLIFAIDAELDDEYDTIGEASDVIFDAPARPEDWSAVADTLAGRLEAGNAEDVDSFSRNYRRDGLTGWIARALGEAGRDGEVRALFEAEARATGSYERLVGFLTEAGCLDDAERWAKEGIAATAAKYAGIARHLAASLRELARKRKQWDVVAAHVAIDFFERPHPSGFDELVKAAARAGVEEPVRAAALHFLETGVAPFRVVAPRPAAGPSTKKATPRSARKTPSPEPKPAAPERPKLKIDPSWPLPFPEELRPLVRPPGPYDPGPRPHLEILLEMAIAAKRPDEVLRWFEAMRSAPRSPGYYDSSLAYADRVADAVAAEYPERTLAIYKAALDAQLPKAQVSAYEAAVGYLKKLRPVYKSLDREGEWDALVASIREKYRNRPRFMELLDRLDGKTIVQSSRSRRG